MRQSYLAQEAKRTTRNLQKLLLRSWIGLIAALGILFVLTRSRGEANMFTRKRYLTVLAIMLAITGIRYINAARKQKNYNNLTLCYQDNTKEAVGCMIDEEAAQGKILVEEYMEPSSNKTKPNGDKVVLLPSYLLLCGKTVTAIPVDKIYWICAQAGYKGGPFIVRIKIFAEHKMYELAGADIEHVQNIVDKIYQYIPNIFSKYCEKQKEKMVGDIWV